MHDLSTNLMAPPPLDWENYPDNADRPVGYIPEGDYTLRLPDEEKPGLFEIRESETRPPKLVTSLFVVAPHHAGHELKYQEFDTALFGKGPKAGKASRASELARAAGSAHSPHAAQYKSAFRTLLGRVLPGAHIIIKTRARDENGEYRTYTENDFPRDPETGRLLPIRTIDDVELTKPIYPRNEVQYFKSRSQSAPF